MAPSKTAKDVTDKQVQAFIKRGLSIPAAAAEAKVSSSVMAGLFYKNEHVVDTSLAITGTPKQKAKAIVAQRGEGVRWERLAERAGMTLAEVKEAFKAETGTDPEKSYAGRGRRFDGSKAAPRAAAANGGRGKSAATAARGGKAKAGPGKARTRAERQAKAGGRSPS